MKHIILLALLQCCFIFSWAQLPAGNNPSAEMHQVIADLKKEIAALEAEIKTAEKEDPDAVEGLRSQLATMKSMLASFDRAKPAPSKAVGSAPGGPKPASAKIPSPVTPVVLNQPVVAPTAAQAKNYYFWYKGKKVNDTTLVTTKGMVVQYSKKREKLIIQPEKKSDPYNGVVQEIIKTEKRKDEMVDQFNKLKNGFIYYPFVKKALAVYDDLSARFSQAVNNTISFNAQGAPVASSETQDGHMALLTHGPSINVVAEGMLTMEGSGGTEDISQKLLLKLEQARREMKQLPSVSDFPAPPTRELGMCANCDTNLMKRQQKIDSTWAEAYHEKETNILVPLMGDMRQFQLLGGQESDSAGTIHEQFNDINISLLMRMRQKDSILFAKYGDKLEYLNAIIPVILGHERQVQLLGFGEEVGSGSIVQQVMAKEFEVYRKYFDEQAGLKNHDFVLNLPFHLGVERQMQLLGSAADDENGFTQTLDRFLAYNHFALTMDIDFVMEKNADDGGLDFKATGAMATPEKIYIMLVVDSCRFKVLPYTTDLSQRTFSDVTVQLNVTSGVKTVKDEDGKLRDYRYTGPPSWSLSFPDGRIDFCSNAKPDTLTLSGFSGGEAVSAAPIDLSNTKNSYTVDMLAYLGQVLVEEEPNEKDIMEMANNMMKTAAGNMQQSAPGSTLEKLKIQYEGYTNMDNARKGLQGAATTKKSLILFNANNRSTVLTDTYQDTKRKLDDGVELKRGMTHLRIVHEPVK